MTVTRPNTSVPDGDVRRKEEARRRRVRRLAQYAVLGVALPGVSGSPASLEAYSPLIEDEGPEQDTKPDDVAGLG